eukprot:NODE_6241_length_643_cov_11.649832_g5310_i0.p4 GENE.NODE_6241_length_643_cov_11.649832_g5310_i0~~NODE_6241_length_643_cov_11.649832_g5310_i0.p4  ORF type:complete len:59 (+),score=2.92 NODE_6241_length_643_cov_11.649832_g5310_i0:232-408(+)
MTLMSHLEASGRRLESSGWGSPASCWRGYPRTFQALGSQRHHRRLWEGAANRSSRGRG